MDTESFVNLGYVKSCQLQGFMQRFVASGFLFPTKKRWKIFTRCSNSSLPIKIYHYFYMLKKN